MANSDNYSEKRKSQRVNVEFIITYKVEKLAQLDKTIQVQMKVSSEEINAIMLDLSESGMAILSSYDIPISTTLLIKFTLINLLATDEERISSIEVSGKVCSNVILKESEHRLGISFIQVTEERKAAIINFIKMSSRG